MVIKFPRINYTNRDFDSIRDSQISSLQKFVPEWTDHNESDLGIVLIDLFAYVHDGTNFYIDTRVNECFLPTARELENVINLLKLIDYNLTNYVPSSAYILFDLPEAVPNDVVIPVGQRIGTTDLNDALIFNGLEEGIIPAGEFSISLPYFEGTFYSESLGVSDGVTPNQEFYLTFNDWIESKIAIFTLDEYGNKTYYTRVNTFIYSDPEDQVYDVKISEFKTTIIFGDGVHGYVPDAGYEIGAEYYRGHGVRGNVAANTITTIIDPIFDSLGNQVEITATNIQAATGGQERESIPQAKVNGPATLRTNNRAINDEDFTTLSNGFRSPDFGVISKSKAVVDYTFYSNVVDVFVVSEDQDRFPILANQVLKDALFDYLETKRMITQEIHIKDATLKPINITADIYCYANYKEADISQEANRLINEMFKVYNMDFAGDGGKIALSDLYSLLNSIDGVDYVIVTNPTANIPVADFEYPTKGSITLNIHGAA